MTHIVLEKIYAGLLGMDAGMRLGALLENPYWNYESIRQYYGDIRGYLRPHTYHTADDDVNGPIIFARGLADNGSGKPLTAEKMGETWLNYTRNGRGMFWWGGEDQSTEHRAYMNLRRGVRAPESGSIALNGKDMAEQIGGQIFIDTWGLIFHGRPRDAAAHARIAASVSHDGSALDGAAFCAACSAAAFEAGSVDAIIDAGLREIPEGCDYANVIAAVRNFHAQHPEDFRACRDYIDNNFENPLGYHIIPNAGICILAMLYGGGDLGRSIEIAVMCGFDTDCNASTIGTILGVFGGLDGVPERYRKPINDNVIISSVSGYLNSVDLADYAKELFELSEKLQGRELPADVRRAEPGGRWLDFALPGSTHCMEMSDRNNHSLRQVPVDGGCLELLVDGKRPAAVDVFIKGMMAFRDLKDERYEPVFSPVIYPGQLVSCKMKSVPVTPDRVVVKPFVTCMEDDRRIDLMECILSEEWEKVTFVIPDLDGDSVHNFGWNIDVQTEEEWIVDKVLIGDVSVSGPMDYRICWARQRKEFGQITPFSFNDCVADLRRQLSGCRLRLTMTGDEFAHGCQAFTGNYYMRDSSVCGAVTVLSGSSGMLIVRGQGTRRYYAAGLVAPGKAGIVKYGGGKKTVLAETDFPWKRDREYKLTVSTHGEEVLLKIDAGNVEPVRCVVTAQDGDYSYGMVGLALDGEGDMLIGDLHITGKC